MTYPQNPEGSFPVGDDEAPTQALAEASDMVWADRGAPTEVMPQYGFEQPGAGGPPPRRGLGRIGMWLVIIAVLSGIGALATVWAPTLLDSSDDEPGETTTSTVAPATTVEPAPTTAPAPTSTASESESESTTTAEETTTTADESTTTQESTTTESSESTTTTEESTSSSETTATTESTTTTTEAAEESSTTTS